MKEPKLLKKIDILLKKKKDQFIVFSIMFVLLLGAIYKTRESYAIETFAGNRMNTFPSEITDQKENISAVYFIKDTQENIDTRYNNASIKADLTYNEVGSVKGWLETDLEDNTKYILYVGSKDTIYLNTGFQLFYIWKNVKTIDFTNADTSKVTNMSGMFYSCSSLTRLDVSNFDTSKVTSMKSMFNNCYSLTNLDLSNFDTSKVTDMSSMFSSCSRLTSLNISNFDTSNVTSMYRMFYNCKSLISLDVSNFDTSNVTNMSSMFFKCISLTSLDLSNFDTSNVTDMGSMFQGCSSLTSLNISNFNTSNVTDMSWMFCECSSLTSLDVSSFDASKVTDMSYIFYLTVKPTKFKWVNVESEIIKITTDNMLVSKLKQNTFNFVTNITKNNVIKEDEEKVVTGDNATFSSKIYRIVVMGDTNGDGNISLTDIMQVARHVYTTNKLSGNYLLAADYNNDNKYNLTDIMQMAKKVYS